MSHPITLPVITVGELLLVVFSVDGNPSANVNTGVSGNNWTKLGSVANGVTVTGAIFYKTAEGSDVLTLSTSQATTPFGNEQSSHVSLSIAGAGVPTATSATGSSTNSNPPAHNPGVAQDYLWVATRSGDSSVVATGAPTNYANLQTQGAGTGGASTNTAERSLNASSEDPGTFTSATEQWVCWTISVPPAAAGSMVPPRVSARRMGALLQM